MNRKEEFAGWRMVAIAFLAQSFAMTVAAGAYGAVMPTLQEELGTSRALISLALGIMLLSLGLISPFVGGLLQKVSIKTIMALGAVLNAVGYLIIAFATEIWQVLMVYALIIGPGACLLGPLTASTLVSRWFDRDRGKALAITNMPIFFLVAQPVAAQLLIHGGRPLPFLTLTAIFIMLIPLTRLVVDRPELIGQVPRPKRVADSETSPVSPVSGRLLTIGDFVRDPRFWLLSLAVGVPTGAGAAFVTHAAAIATDKGIELILASTLISFFGAGSICGAIAFGWLADRIGPLASLAINTGTQAVIWSALILVHDLPVLWMLSALVGFCMGAVVALHGAAINALFGVQNFSKAMGFSYFLKVPFLLGFAPLAGALYDLSGSYDTALLVNSAAFASASTVFLLMALHARGMIWKRTITLRA